MSRASVLPKRRSSLQPWNSGGGAKTPAGARAPRWADLQHEEFWILLLRRSNLVLADVCISRGGLTGTVVDPKLVFGRAVALRAAAMVLVHNHPSGNPKPSASDRELTANLCRAGEYLDLPVLDHVIVAGGAFVSFADEGWLRRIPPNA